MTEAEIQCVERIVEKEARRVINVVIEHVATLLEQELGDRHEIAARAKRVRSLKIKEASANGP